MIAPWQLLEHHRATLGEDHPDTLHALSQLASAYDAAGQAQRALPLYEQTFLLRRSKLGAEHPHTLQSMGALASSCAKNGDVERAVGLLRECVEIHYRALPDHPMTFYAEAVLGKMLIDVGQFDDAERHLLRGYEGLRATESQLMPMEKWDRLLFAPHFLAELYDKWDKPAEAGRWRQIKAEVMRELSPPAPTTLPATEHAR